MIDLEKSKKPKIDHLINQYDHNVISLEHLLNYSSLLEERLRSLLWAIEEFGDGSSMSHPRLTIAKIDAHKILK